MSERSSTTAPGGLASGLTGAITLRLRTPARMRNLELLLLLFAFVITAGALVLVQLGALGAVDSQIFTYAAGLDALVLIMHIALRLVAVGADPFILPTATVLNGIGIAMIYRIDLAEGREGWEAGGIRQMAWTAIAMFAALAVLVVIRNHRVLQRYRYIAMFLGIALLLLPLVPGIGREINGSQVWIGIGPQRADGSVPLSFQPGELAKIALAVFFAGYLVTARDSLSLVGRTVLGIRFPRIRDLGPILVIWVAAMGVLVFQRDLGTSLLYFGLFLVMIYVATGRLSWVLLGLALFIGGAAAASQSLGYVSNRFSGWLDAFGSDVYERAGGSYQLVQGLFGMADGGLIGTGLGQGRPDLVPLAESDFIVASIGEELGLVGLFAVLCLYLLLVSRGFRIGFAGHDDFGRLLGVGLSFVVALQVFIVIGGITRVIPLTGLTTPFLAAGGSSLVANWIIVALLLRLSDTVRDQPRPALEEQSRGRSPGGPRVKNELRGVSVVVVAMFVALFTSSTLISVVRADDLRADGRNTRTLYESYSAERGPILVDGAAIAESVAVDDEYRFQRRYTQPELYSAVTGYFTLNQGDSGLEGSLNDYLSGTANDQFFDQVNALLTGQDPKGAAVATTIDPVAQQVAFDALGDNAGAVVAIDPRTGAILALVSRESYDPNALAGHDTAQVIANYTALIDDPDRPLLNRAIAGDLYAPGSVFKLVVASAAIDSGQFTPDSEFPNPSTLQLPGSSTVITNAEGGDCGGGPTVSLATALRLSCNIPFAQLGAALGAETINDYAERYGFGLELAIPQAVTPSVYPAPDDPAQLMLSAFGQDDDRVTPLQIAMISATIANGGELLRPSLVRAITAPDLREIQGFDQDTIGRSTSADTAATMTRLMVANVADGAAGNARINGVDVAGKTGTAQNDGRDNTLWFTGFAPADDPVIAVAVVVENNPGFGNAVAAPIAKKVIEAVLNE